MRSAVSAFLLMLSMVVLSACQGERGPAGPAGEEGPPGPPGGDNIFADAGTDGGVVLNQWTSIQTGPGVKLLIDGVGVAQDGTMTVTFRLTDNAGVPLHREGRFTEGPVAVSFVAARFPVDDPGIPGPYLPITTRTQNAPNGQSAVQASADSGGTFAEADVPGTYTYTFTAKTATDALSATHSVGGYATRTFNGQRYVSNAVHNFVPSGGAMPAVRETSTTETCNKCHGTLEAHGGARRDYQLCILCHTAGVVDPDTGNSVDMAVMAHKIHYGEHLPSVQAGTPYQIVGFMQSVHDYSTVVFPQDVRYCDTCHQGAHADAWKTNPTAEACGACHDNVSFVDPPPAGMVLHTGGPQANNAQCAVCHTPTAATGGISPIAEAHQIPGNDPAAPNFELEIQSVTNTGPGQQPVITFAVRVDGAPRNITAEPLARLGAVIAGPTVPDYERYLTATAQGGGATGTLTAVDAAMGIFSYTLPAAAAIPSDATGTWGFSLEGYVQRPGSTTNYAAYNPVFYAPVTDAMAVPRRSIVDIESCNNCHRSLAAHGGVRKNPDQCAFCHNPDNTGDERIARLEGETVQVESVHLKYMIHKIHMGEELTQGFELGGFPAPSATNPAGNPVDFSHVRFPDAVQRCESCHKPDTYLLPLTAGLLPTRFEELTCTEDPGADTNSFCATRVQTDESFLQPATSACVSCHDSPDALAHALLNTLPTGQESCATCHGQGREFDVAAVHQVAP